MTTLYQPQNGWDATVLIKLSSESIFEDASEIYGIKFDEGWGLDRRKKLGTKTPGFVPGIYEAKASAKAYFITGAMVKKIFGIDGTDKDNERKHSTRIPKNFDLKIDFSSFPIEVDPTTSPVTNLVGYTLEGCFLNEDSYELTPDEYVEKPLEIVVTEVKDVYDTDT